jgi:streptomycin 6-kinase
LSGYQNDHPIVLKLTLDESSLEKEMTALKAFSDYGGISILNYQKDALLLKRAIPGTALKNHPKAIQIACAVISRLNKAPIPANHTFPHVIDWLSILDNSWNMPVKYLEKARILKKQLLTFSYPITLLHGDLHQGNILLDNSDWLVIDPKGVIGFPINETWACVEDLDNDLKYIANFFDYPLDQVIQWYYVHLILAVCWQLEDNLDPSLFLNLARSVYPMIG